MQRWYSIYELENGEILMSKSRLKIMDAAREIEGEINYDKTKFIKVTPRLDMKYRLLMHIKHHKEDYVLRTK